MKRVLLLLAAVLAGLGLSETFFRSPPCRARIERLLFRNEETVIARNLHDLSRGETVAPEEVEREMNLLRAQFGDENAFARALKESRLNEAVLRADLTEQLRARSCFEKQVAPSLKVNEEETREFYTSHQAHFLRPERYRAAHIFLATPDGLAPEIVAAKQSAIQGLAVRLLAGEKFEQLAAEASEDEATKRRGGDLGYFSAARMPPEFIAEIEKLSAGEMSSPLRSHLGFHLVVLTEIKPGGEMTLEEARAEIENSLGTSKRVAVLAQCRERLRATD